MKCKYLQYSLFDTYTYAVPPLIYIILFSLLSLSSSPFLQLYLQSWRIYIYIYTLSSATNASTCKHGSTWYFKSGFMVSILIYWEPYYKIGINNNKKHQCQKQENVWQFIGLLPNMQNRIVQLIPYILVQYHLELPPGHYPSSVRGCLNETQKKRKHTSIEKRSIY